MERYAATTGVITNSKGELIIHVHVMRNTVKGFRLGSSMTLRIENGIWILDKQWESSINDYAELQLMLQILYPIIGRNIEVIKPNRHWMSVSM
jgi:hypothetical protein